jgi:hypothetical protein
VSPARLPKSEKAEPKSVLEVTIESRDRRIGETVDEFLPNPAIKKDLQLQPAVADRGNIYAKEVCQPSRHSPVAKKPVEQKERKKRARNPRT